MYINCSKNIKKKKMLGALAGIGKTLLGELFSKGVSTVGQLARKTLDTYIPLQNAERAATMQPSSGEYSGGYAAPNSEF